MTKLKLNDVVQFNENHKWCGALGIVNEVKELENDTKYLIGEATNLFQLGLRATMSRFLLRDD
nr:MAG TPA: hypothetical protein [Caudoviricetes sp.]